MIAQGLGPIANTVGNLRFTRLPKPGQERDEAKQKPYEGEVSPASTPLTTQKPQWAQAMKQTGTGRRQIRTDRRGGANDGGWHGPRLRPCQSRGQVGNQPGRSHQSRWAMPTQTPTEGEFARRPDAPEHNPPAFCQCLKVMSDHHATVRWTRREPEFVRGRYSREHSWHFDGGVTVPASPSPHVVPAPWSNPTHVDPEEGFVAAVASCHMLTFLWLASRAGWVVDHYEDEAVGHMTPNANGVPWVSTVELRPRIAWGGEHPPSPDEIERLHHEAHEQCFIAQSIKSHVSVHPPTP